MEECISVWSDRKDEAQKLPEAHKTTPWIYKLDVGYPTDYGGMDPNPSLEEASFLTFLGKPNYPT